MDVIRLLQCNLNSANLVTVKVMLVVVGEVEQNSATGYQGLYRSICHVDSRREVKVFFQTCDNYQPMSFQYLSIKFQNKS